MKTIGLLSCLFFVSSLLSSELTTLKTYDKLLKLSQNDRGYSLQNDTFAMHFPTHQVSKSIRDLRADQLAALLKSNAYYLKATQLSDGTHALGLEGRVNGGLLEGAAGGAIAGSVLGKYACVCVSVAGLFLVQGAVHVFAGPEKGAAFKQAIFDTYLPNIYEFSDKVVGPVFGVAGAGIGLVATPV